MEGNDTRTELKTYEVTWLHKRVTCPDSRMGTVTRVRMKREHNALVTRAWVAIDGGPLTCYDVGQLTREP